MLQRVREGGDETDIIRRLPAEVGISLRAGKTDDEEELQRLRATLRLDPVPARAVRRDQRAVPKANLFRPRAELGTSNTMLHTSWSAK